jgi:hypothetical protein
MNLEIATSTFNRADNMTTEIDGRALAGVEVATDGTFFRLKLTDTAEREASVKLPTDCLRSLIVTLPSLATQALRLRHKDESLRIVYPAHTTFVERSTDPDVFIVTFGTPDAFQVSFGLSASQFRSISECIDRAEDTGDSIPLLV